ncbi:MAG: hypothetical protein N3B12_03700 [Armatimonadetes bacterium]|nr:hypothetical protein [Armatimonadota bacterium]
MTSKERILVALEHREADRVPIWENFWGSTIRRWHKEGLTEDTDPTVFFGLDTQHHTSIDWTLQFPVETIEETEEYVIRRNANGDLEKSFKDHDSTPLWSDYPITDRASWKEHKSRFLWNESRVDIQAAKKA